MASGRENCPAKICSQIKFVLVLVIGFGEFENEDEDE